MTNQLRIKLRNGKLRRHRLVMELRTFEKKKESANQVKNVFHGDTNTTTAKNVNVKTNADSIQEEISGVVLMGKEGLVELNESGKAMIQTLNHVKASRGEKKDDETLVEFGRLMKEKALEAQRPMKKMTLEEDYEERKNMNMTAGGGGSSRVVVSNLLKKKGQDTTKSNDE